MSVGEFALADGKASQSGSGISVTPGQELVDPIDFVVGDAAENTLSGGANIYMPRR